MAAFSGFLANYFGSRYDLAGTGYQPKRTVNTGYFNTVNTPLAGYGGYGNNSDSYTDSLSLVAANSHARMWGDPHIDDADGGKYEFQETGFYNILEDKGLTINGSLNKSKDGKSTYLTEAGLMVEGNKLHIGVDGSMTYGPNGDTLNLKDGESQKLGQNSNVTRQGNIIRLNTPEYNVEFLTNQNDNGNQHLDVDIYSKENGVNADGILPTGLLGETFDEDSIAQDKIRLKASAYQRENLFETEQSDTPKKFRSFG
ncbi:MAG: hypothetical protein K0Q50_1912 [Vampirovibrio sp.]|jgi:hypothetical protein|nr:hypothetical protein [Vampirovibrio sp.]